MIEPWENAFSSSEVEAASTRSPGSSLNRHASTRSSSTALIGTLTDAASAGIVTGEDTVASPVSLLAKLTVKALVVSA